MGIFNFWKRIFEVKPRRVRTPRTRRVRPSIGNVLELDVGRYLEDEAHGNDYAISFKVKRGRVKKTVLRRMKKHENTYMFNRLELTPITQSAYVVVIKETMVPMHLQIPKKKWVWKVILKKTKKGRRPLRIKIS